MGEHAFLASDAAAAALTAGGPDAAVRALGLLELGRAVLHGQALDTRTDLTELRISHPALARRFTQLRDALEGAGDDGAISALTSVAGGPSPAAARPLGQVKPGQDKHRVATDFADLLDEIRRLAGFESFLLPPGPREAMRHANRGPIVVFNISRSRSDALIVTASSITALPLPGLAFAAVRARVDAFNAAPAQRTDPRTGDAAGAEEVLSQTLEWLWDAAAEPVLTHLGYTQLPARTWPRVWWAPGGLLGLLPLHASGYHRQPDRSRTVLDRVISSYTPTLRALGYARQREGSSSPAHALIVAMPETPGQASLPGTREEATRLRGRLPSPVVLVGDGNAGPAERVPTKAEVIARLPEAGIAHFSCHSLSIPDDPSRSFLALADYRADPFTVASLVEVSLHRAQLAYLSACQTARNAAPDLLDEAIHLASAFQLAGYPHVIGTLWSVWEVAALDVADTFYAHLQTGVGAFDTRTSAEALHHAVRALRDREGLAAAPSFWAPFLHTGA
ncbi:MAG: CHAT domain-containing protein [Streptosporangiaceae bacterium]